MRNVGAVVFDKTGTLTKGNFSVNRIEAFDKNSEEDILEIGAGLERFSNHPIAKAIVEKYSGAFDEEDLSHIKEFPGKGVEGTFRGRRAIIGNRAMMEMHDIEVPDLKNYGTSVFVALSGKLSGILSIADDIKDGAAEGIQELKEVGIKKIVMLTGDREGIARRIAEKLGISEVFSQLMPHEKVKRLEAAMKNAENKNVVFVGDGINDAPVLIRSDVGIAMGSLGSDIAIEAADVVLMNDEIKKVAEAIRISKFTGRIIWQNIAMALITKIAIMLLGTLGIANMWTAVFGDVGVALLAIVNSGRTVCTARNPN